MSKVEGWFTKCDVKLRKSWKCEGVKATFIQHCFILAPDFWHISCAFFLQDRSLNDFSGMGTRGAKKCRAPLYHLPPMINRNRKSNLCTFYSTYARVRVTRCANYARVRVTRCANFRCDALWDVYLGVGQSAVVTLKIWYHRNQY